MAAPSSKRQLAIPVWVSLWLEDVGGIESCSSCQTRWHARKFYSARRWVLKWYSHAQTSAAAIQIINKILPRPLPRVLLERSTSISLLILPIHERMRLQPDQKSFDRCKAISMLSASASVRAAH